MELTFNKQYTELLEEITELYGRAKELMLFAEEIDPQKRTHFQPINELRHAFDHEMRIFAVKFNIYEPKKVSKAKYIKKNLDKAVGHVYRSCYDTLDWISINMRLKITEEVKGFSNESIKTTIPTYYSEIRPFCEYVDEEIAKLRSDKDVAECRENPGIDHYVTLIKQLRTHHNTIIKAKPSMIEHKQKEDEQKWKDVLKALAIGTFLAIFSAIVISKIMT